MRNEKSLTIDQLSDELYSLEFTEQLESKAEMMLLDGINLYGKERKGMPNIQLFGLFLKEFTGQELGGLSGMFCYGCMHIDMLWIDENARGNGWGKKIMEEAEERAKERSCSFSTLETMDWEALPFYQKLGYTIEYIRHGYQNNSTMYLLRKQYTEVFL